MPSGNVPVPEAIHNKVAIKASGVWSFDLTYMLCVELAWRSGSVMDCHATARGSIPSGNSARTELHVLRRGQ